MGGKKETINSPMKNLNLVVNSWPDYELLDSGDNQKLERFGKFTLVRPETQALWAPRRPELWKRASAEFRREGEKGSWRKGNKEYPNQWPMTWGDVFFEIRLTNFKHTGVFPEQAANWEWLAARASALKNPKVLNLFGYTGIASIVAAQAGAQMTHVDASKQSNVWAKENAKLSGVPENGIRFLLDDALKFAERELRRGAQYDGIILDPPAFGRGAKGEVWHIEEHLPRLLATLSRLLAPRRNAFFLLNGYAAGYSPHSFKQLVESHFDLAQTSAEFGELHLAESGKPSRVVPSGIYVRFVRNI
jgi:23S rRNA (cytosine1962-C5)-methyltransferase